MSEKEDLLNNPLVKEIAIDYALGAIGRNKLTYWEHFKSEHYKKEFIVDANPNITKKFEKIEFDLPPKEREYPKGIIAFSYNGIPHFPHNKAIDYQLWCKWHFSQTSSEIHSVTNSSDETLTIGQETNHGKISSIKIENDILVVYCDGFSWLYVVDEVHPKQVLKTEKLKKPPIGIIPKYIHDEHRFVALNDAIIRYLDAKLSVPQEWYDEAAQLNRDINNRLTKSGL